MQLVISTLNNACCDFLNYKIICCVYKTVLVRCIRTFVSTRHQLQVTSYMSRYTGSSIVPVKDKWAITIKEERRSSQYSVSIEQDATVRKLYRAVKKACGVTTAIELRSRSGDLIVKDDRRLTAAAVTGPTELLLRILPTPDVFTIFVTLPGRQEQSTIQIEESQSLEELHTAVKHRIDKDHPPPEIQLEYGAEVYIENKDDKLISKELFDGATLRAKYVKITVYVNDGRRIYSINASLNATVKEFFKELSRHLPNHDFRLITGTQQLDQEDNLCKTLTELGITHLTTVTVVTRFNGGGSDLSREQEWLVSLALIPS